MSHLILSILVQRLPGLDRVTVSSLEGDALCSVAGSVFAVTFVGVSSPLAMTITALSSSFKAQHLGVRVNGFSSHVNPYLKSRAVSDVEALECSGHGICDYATGDPSPPCPNDLL